jgi:tetratricopeptide (TPR) repeat protein
MSIVKEIKAQIARFTTELGILVGFLAICIALVSNISEAFNSQKILIVVGVGLCVIILRVCYRIRNPEKDAEGQPKTHYSEKQKRWAGRAMVIICILVPVSISAVVFGNLDKKEFAIIVTPFDEPKDPFSDALFRNIGKYKKAKGFDSIQARFHDEFLKRKDDKSTTIISKIFENEGSNRGLLVFGARSAEKDEKFFNCYIYINNLSKLGVDSTMIDRSESDKQVIYMLNPLFIEFEYSTQAEIVADFIMGLLYIHSDQLQKAEETFTLIKGGVSQGNTGIKVSKQLRSNCDYWLGDIYSKKEQYEEAINAYTDAGKYDTANAFILNRLAILQLQYKKDTAQAYELFMKAHEVDASIPVPISEPITYRLWKENFYKQTRDTTTSLPTNTEDSMIHKSVARTPGKKTERFNINTTNSVFPGPSGTLAVKPQTVVSSPTLTAKNNSTLANTPLKIVSPAETKPITNSFNALPTHENEFDETDVLYQVKLYHSRSNLYYIARNKITKNEELVLFTDASGKFYKIIGYFVKSGYKSYTIQDLNKNSLYGVLDNKIISNNVCHGELIPLQ